MCKKTGGRTLFSDTAAFSSKRAYGFGPLKDILGLEEEFFCVPDDETG